MIAVVFAIPNPFVTDLLEYLDDVAEDVIELPIEAAEDVVELTIEAAEEIKREFKNVPFEIKNTSEFPEDDDVQFYCINRT